MNVLMALAITSLIARWGYAEHHLRMQRRENRLMWIEMTKLRARAQ